MDRNFFFYFIPYHKPYWSWVSEETFCDTYWNRLINYWYLQSWAYWQHWLLYSVPPHFSETRVWSHQTLNLRNWCHSTWSKSQKWTYYQNMYFCKNLHIWSRFIPIFALALRHLLPETRLLCKMRLILWKQDKVFHRIPVNYR